MSNSTVTITVLARRLGLAPRAIRRLEEIGAFVPHVPGKWVYFLSDVNGWLEQTTAGRVKTLDEVRLAVG
jgi:hypothetical protein